MLRALAASVAIATLVACTPAPPDPDGGVLDDAGAPDAGTDAGPEAPDGLASLDEVSDLDLLANERGSVKFLLPVEGVPPRAPLGEACAFQNTARYPYHLQYLQTLPGGEELRFDDYVALVLRRQTRAWWGGEVLWREAQPHPLTGAEGVLVYTLYTEDSPGNRLVIDDVRAVHAALTECAPAFEDALAFAPSSNEQRATAPSLRDQLAAEGIAVLTEP